MGVSIRHRGLEFRLAVTCVTQVSPAWGQINKMPSGLQPLDHTCPWGVQFLLNAPPIFWSVSIGIATSLPFSTGYHLLPVPGLSPGRHIHRTVAHHVFSYFPFSITLSWSILIAGLPPSLLYIFQSFRGRFPLISYPCCSPLSPIWSTKVLHQEQK